MKKINQYEVGEWLGITRPGTLSNIFSGRRRPGRMEAARLEKVSGVSFEDWMLLDSLILKKKVFDAYELKSTGRKKQ